MKRGVRAGVAGLVAVVVATVLASPASTAAAEKQFVVEGLMVRCVEAGAPLELPTARWVRDSEPVVGRSVRWVVRSAVVGVPAIVTDAVVTDSEGRAVPPRVEATVDRSTSVAVQVLTDHGWLGGDDVKYNVAGTRLIGGSVRVDAFGYSDLVRLQGHAPTTYAVGDDGGCVESVPHGAEVEAFLVRDGSTERTPIGSVSLPTTGSDGTWRLSTYLPDMERHRVEAETSWNGMTERRWSNPVSAAKDTPSLGGALAGTRIFPQRGEATVYRVPSGATRTMRIELAQDRRRPADIDGPGRVVEVRFRHLTTGKVTRLPDVRLERRGDLRLVEVKRSIRSSGWYDLTYRGSATEEPARGTFGVRLEPRIDFPARTTRATPHRAIQRTVTISSGTGLKAQLQHRNGKGWVASGPMRAVQANGKVRLGSHNRTRDDRVHRVVLWAHVGNGAHAVVSTTKGTWTVRNR